MCIVGHAALQEVVPSGEAAQLGPGGARQRCAVTSDFSTARIKKLRCSGERRSVEEIGLALIGGRFDLANVPGNSETQQDGFPFPLIGKSALQVWTAGGG